MQEHKHCYTNGTYRFADTGIYSKESEIVAQAACDRFRIGERIQETVFLLSSVSRSHKRFGRCSAAVVADSHTDSLSNGQDVGLGVS